MHGPAIWSDAVIRPARFGPFRLMHHPDSDQIGKPRGITKRQTSYDSVVLMKVTGVKRGFPIYGDQ